MKPKIIYQVWGVGVASQEAWAPKPLMSFETMQEACNAIETEPPTRDIDAGLYVWKKNWILNQDLWIQQAWTLA